MSIEISPQNKLPTPSRENTFSTNNSIAQNSQMSTAKSCRGLSENCGCPINVGQRQKSDSRGTRYTTLLHTFQKCLKIVLYASAPRKILKSCLKRTHLVSFQKAVHLPNFLRKHNIWYAVHLVKVRFYKICVKIGLLKTKDLRDLKYTFLLCEIQNFKPHL